MEKPSLLNHVIKYGVIIGLVGIVISVLTYIVSEALMVKWWYGLLILAINIGIIIYAGAVYRKALGGYIDYKDAFLVTFLTMIFAGFIGLLFGYIQFSILDPDLGNRLSQLTIEQAEQMMQKFGAPQDQIDQQIEKLSVDMPKRFSIMGQVKTFFTWQLGGSLVFAAIIALIVRKREPELKM